MHIVAIINCDVKAMLGERGDQCWHNPRATQGAPQRCDRQAAVCIRQCPCSLDQRRHAT